MDTEKKQLELDKRYIRMASIWAENSYCQRRKVGACCKGQNDHTDGYNGTPSGSENVCEDENNDKALCPSCGSKRYHQDSTLEQQQRRRYNVRHRLILHRNVQN